jgi:hypothetical protein
MPRLPPGAKGRSCGKYWGAKCRRGGDMPGPHVRIKRGAPYLFADVVDENLFTLPYSVLSIKGHEVICVETWPITLQSVLFNLALPTSLPMLCSVSGKFTSFLLPCTDSEQTTSRHFGIVFITSVAFSSHRTHASLKMATRDCVTPEQLQQNLNRVSIILSFYATAPSSYRLPGNTLFRIKCRGSNGTESLEAVPTPSVTPTDGVMDWANLAGNPSKLVEGPPTAPIRPVFLVKHYGGSIG